MATQPVLSLVRPLAVQEPKSVEFMLKDLARSGLVPEDIDAFAIGLQVLNTTPAYVIPYPCSERMYRIRYDRATDKYIQPKGIVGIWWSPKQYPHTFPQAEVVYLIEGEKKAAAFVKRWPHLPTFGIGGAHMALVKAENGIHRLHDDLLTHVAPKAAIHAIFDGDIQEKQNIQKAATNLKDACIAAGIELKVFCPPNSSKGVDDWLVEAPDAKIEDLVYIDAEKLAASKRALITKLKLQINEDGQPLNIDFNLKSLLENYFRDRVYLDKRFGFLKDESPCDYNDLVSECLDYIATNFIKGVGKSRLENILPLAVHKRDLVRELVLRQKWDGIKRLDTWGAEHLISEMPAFANEWGRLLISGLCLRITEPGIKFDYVPILIGPQGIGKSTFFEDLSFFEGHQFYHSCVFMGRDSGDSSRTQIISFIRSVIVDLSEGAVFQNTKMNIDILKQRISQTSDEYRVVYARSTSIEQRGFIFVGTSNRHDQLSDVTGTRRYLMLRVSKINKLPYHTKLQLLAEVVARRYELDAGMWYDMRLELNDVPQALRDAHPHIQNAQALINSQFTKEDSTTERIQIMLDAQFCARMANDELFITPAAIGFFIGETDSRSIDRIKSALISLSASPAFPYSLRQHRVRGSQLTIPEEVKTGYQLTLGTELQPKSMISGFVATRK